MSVFFFCLLISGMDKVISHNARPENCTLVCENCSSDSWEIDEICSSMNATAKNDESCTACCGTCREGGHGGLFLQRVLSSKCNIPPQQKVCPNENINFYLYRSHTKLAPEIITGSNSLNGSQFDPTLRTKILIHGFNESKDSPEYEEIRTAYFRTSPEHNIITVDYAPLVNGPSSCYEQATRNAYLTAVCTAQFIDQLVEQGVRIKDIHVIGFSLGGQIAGQLTDFLKSGKLKRLTALDPAGPLYFNFLHTLISKDDADFVDVIHTNAGVFGLLGPNGHVDFYPNGGTLQPGCNKDTMKGTVVCNHKRALLYFAESITNPKGFMAFQCTGTSSRGNWGRCPQKLQVVIPMGEHVARGASGSFYLMTAERRPFALGRQGARKQNFQDKYLRRGRS